MKMPIKSQIKNKGRTGDTQKKKELKNALSMKPGLVR